MLVKRQPISHSERENYEQGVSWKPCVVIFYFTTKPLSLSSKSISIKSNKTIIFSLLYHIFTHVIPSSIHQQLEEKLLK